MDNKTLLELLNQHLNLLIEATENCETLSGESVASTLFLIQMHVRELMKHEKSP